jgi:hypothetical protein
LQQSDPVHDIVKSSMTNQGNQELQPQDLNDLMMLVDEEQNGQSGEEIDHAPMVRLTVDPSCLQHQLNNSLL